MSSMFRAAALAAALAVALPAQARNFRSSDVHPADYPTVEAVKHFGKLLSEQSSGRHGVRVFANGALGMHDGVALFAGVSTVPAARGLGAQAALLGARLAYARDHGCTVAMMVASVGSTSQRNAERNGFRVA